MARALPLLVALLVVPAASATPNGPGGTTRAAVTIPLAPAFAPLDLVPPAGADWATNGGDYGQTRYSSLKEVTKANVRRLKLKWHVHLNGSGAGSKYKGEGTPLVYKGIMYIGHRRRRRLRARRDERDASSGSTTPSFRRR